MCLFQLKSNGNAAVGEKQCLSNTTVKSKEDAEAIVSNNNGKEQNVDRQDNLIADPQTKELEYITMNECVNQLIGICFTSIVQLNCWMPCLFFIQIQANERTSVTVRCLAGLKRLT